MRNGLTERGLSVAAGGGTLAAAGSLLGFPELTRLGLTAVLLVLACRVSLGLAKPLLQVEVASAGGGPDTTTGQAGDTLPLPLRVRATSPSPSCRLTLPSPAGSSATTWHLPSLGRDDTLDLDWSVTLRGRGIVPVPRPWVDLRDVFGFCRVRHPVPALPHTIVALPRTHDLRPAPHAAMAGAGPGTADDGLLREYRPGDDLRHVHWSASAHRGELMTRHPDRIAPPTLIAVVDPRLPGDVEAPALEWGIEFVASVLAGADDAGWRTELLTAGELGAPVRRVDRRDEILMELACFPSARGPGRSDPPVDDLRALLASRRGRADTVVLLGAETRHGDLLPLLPPTTRGLNCLLPGPADIGSTPITPAPRTEPITDPSGWTTVSVDPGRHPADVWRSFEDQERVR